MGQYSPSPYPPPPPYAPQPYPQSGPYDQPPPYSQRPIITVDPANPNFWIGVEALMWWTKNQPLSVPLITTGPASEGANAGGLGQPGTVSLNGPLNYGVEGGIRFFGGGWFSPDHTLGMDASMFFLGRQHASFGAFDRSGNGDTVINEPVNGAPFVTQVSAPGVETGGVTVDATTRFWGADVNALWNIYRSNGWSINLLGGFRYLQLEEWLNITANSTLFTTTTYTDNFGNVLATAPPGSVVTVIDQFGTRNQFYGGQIGAQAQYSMDRWFFSAAAKVAIGDTHETVLVNGSTTVYPVNASPVFLGGGNYANIQAGRYSANKFAVAPELNLNVGYQFTPFIRGTIGYNFIYLSSVVRPGNQIDNNFDGVVHPLVPMATSTFWAQGINFNLTFNF